MPASLTNTVGVSAGAKHSLAVEGEPPRIVVPPFDVLINTSQPLPVSNVTFTVVAEGTRPLMFQWFYLAFTNDSGTNSMIAPTLQAIAGATNSSMSFTNVGFAFAGFYLVTVSNVLAAVTSAPVRIEFVTIVNAALNGGAPPPPEGNPGAPPFMPEPYLATLSVTGVTGVAEGSAADFVVTAFLSTGALATNPPQFAISAFGITAQGRLTTGKVRGDTNLLLTVTVNRSNVTLIATNTIKVLNVPARIDTVTNDGSGVFGFSGSGPPSQIFALEVSETLTDWVVLLPVMTGSNGVLHYLDASATNVQRRFYRIRETD